MYLVRVYDADSAPIAGATITFGDESAETTDAGVASFPDPAPNTWPMLQVVAAGYALDRLRIFAMDDGARCYLRATA